MKKFLFAVAAAVLLVAMPKLQASAQVTTENIQGLTCTYDDVTKTLSITGEGSLGGFENQFGEIISALRDYTLTEKVCIKDATLTGSAFAGFYDFKNLKEVTIENVDTARITDMSYLFYGCSSLTGVDVSLFDTSQVTDMSWMFWDCKKLSSLDVSRFNTSQVTDMSYMFGGCSGLSSLDVSRFDTSQVTDMGGMFYDCGSLTYLDVSNFNTAGVTNMAVMFSCCRGLTDLDVSHFNTSQVTGMSQMFFNCSGLSSLDVSRFDTARVKHMYGMFYHCSGLSSLDVSRFDTSQVTSMWQLFSGCSGLRDLDVSSFHTAQVTNMSYMFSGCSGLSDLEVSSFDTSQVTDMTAMFSGCSGLSSLEVSSFDTALVTDMSYMFHGCSGLSSLDLSNFNTVRVWDMEAIFSGCNSLAALWTPGQMGETQKFELPRVLWDEQGIEYTEITAANCGTFLSRLSTGGIYLMSADRNGFVAGLTTNAPSQTELEYRWTACRKASGETMLVKDWIANDCWLNWQPEEFGEYVLTAEARRKDEPSECVSAQSETIRYTPHIKGKCQMPYTGEGGGYLIGIETYENPNQSYTYEMLILDCTLLAEGKDAWIYTTGRCGVAEGNALWTIWQPRYGYYWTLFRVYDENGVMIDEDCYGFVNAY